LQLLAHSNILANLPGGIVGGPVVGSGVVNSVKLTNNYFTNKEASTVLCMFCCKFTQEAIEHEKSVGSGKDEALSSIFPYFLSALRSF